MTLSRIVTCDFCGDEVLTHQTVLPDEWILMWDYPEIICGACQVRWKERFGEEPAYLEKGKDKELTLFERMES